MGGDALCRCLSDLHPSLNHLSNDPACAEDSPMQGASSEASACKAREPLTASATLSKNSIIKRPVLISPRMKDLYDTVTQIASKPCPVLILGESGTGKELVARAIHSQSKNRNGRFIAIDCGALAPSIIESELFGHARGAFTGADHAREGLLSSADRGTIFLDEIGEIPLDLQVKLLRTLQEMEVRPMGSNSVRTLTARVVSATNRDLLRMVEQGTFRKDLFFRLNVVNLTVPPLRERKEEIPELAELFLRRLRARYELDFRLDPITLDILQSYEWPGNVRELENVIERACALAEGPLLTADQLPAVIRKDWGLHWGTPPQPRADGATSSHGTLQQHGDHKHLPLQTLDSHVREIILTTIKQLNGDVRGAARILGIGHTTIYRKLKAYRPQCRP